MTNTCRRKYQNMSEFVDYYQFYCQTVQKKEQLHLQTLNKKYLPNYQRINQPTQKQIHCNRAQCQQAKRAPTHRCSKALSKQRRRSTPGCCVWRSIVDCTC